MSELKFIATTDVMWVFDYSYTLGLEGSLMKLVTLSIFQYLLLSQWKYTSLLDSGGIHLPHQNNFFKFIGTNINTIVTYTGLQYKILNKQIA